MVFRAAICAIEKLLAAWINYTKASESLPAMDGYPCDSFSPFTHFF
jgi:hypothetical protein